MDYNPAFSFLVPHSSQPTQTHTYVQGMYNTHMYIQTLHIQQLLYSENI